MNLILDTNALLWWLMRHPRLAQSRHWETIQTAPRVGVSVVSPWELWIKQHARGLALPDDLDDQLVTEGFTMLAPTVEDAKLAAELPLIHRDPFDRMIVAQAMRFNAPVVTSDRTLQRYDVDVLLV
ncbi:MAG: type II toxin-antitoxin system VapC family toxin [Oxalobacteraceae bacterium]|nr:MAG: type II toxin-antitoxin system VapC family toxin [Oxalobacteraceae bacterium]